MTSPIKITGINLYLYHTPKTCYRLREIYTISDLYPTSTTPSPTTTNGIDFYLYHTPKTWYMFQEIYTISDLYHTSPPPLPRLLQLKLMGQTSTSTTPSKHGRGCKKYILYLTSTTPLPHLLQLKLL